MEIPKAFWRGLLTYPNILGISLIAGIIASSFAVFISTRQTSQDQAMRRMASASGIFSGYIERVYHNADAVTLAIESDLRADKAFTSSAYQAYAGSAKRHEALRLTILGTDMEAITLVDGRGQFIGSSRSWPPPAINIADREYFNFSRSHPEIPAFASGLLRNRSTGQRTMFWARRLTDDDKGFLGLILTTLDSEFFQKLFQENLPNPAAVISVYRRDGSLLQTTSEDEKNLADAAARGPAYVDRLRQGNVTATAFEEPEEATRSSHLTAIHSRPDSRFVIIISIPRSVALEAWTRFAQFIGLFTGLALSLAGWCWWAMLKAEQNKRGAIERSAQLARANSELHSANNALNAANDALEAFSYSVAHDLRVPLRHIRGYCATGIEESDASAGNAPVESMRKITEAAINMSELIDNLLQLSHISRRAMIRTSIDLSDLSATLTGTLAEAHRERRVDVVIAPAMRCEADPGLMRIAMENLLRNAWKFTALAEHARIEIGCKEDGRERVYFVRDNGVGFDTQFSSRLFGVFQRLPSAQKFEGTGIGLSIVKRIIARHDGRIWAEAGIGKGAAFFFTLGNSDRIVAPG